MTHENKFVFIVTTAENGASLVQGLLDGHPQLDVIPFLCNFYKYYHKFGNNLDAIADAIENYPIIKMAFSGGSSVAYGDFRKHPLSRELFRKTWDSHCHDLRNNESISTSDIFKITCKSIIASMERRGEERRGEEVNSRTHPFSG